jgi:hypothetical protein
MTLTTALLCLVLAAPDEPPPAASAKALEALQQLHHDEAKSWTMYLDKDRRTKAEFRSKPIYVWTNPTRSHGQHGAVFVWTHEGRPVVVSSTFSHPEMKRRMVCYEFHSLALKSLVPENRDAAAEKWEPRGPIELHPLPGAPVPDASAARRLGQMRALARDFTAHSIDYQKERWELRLLTAPLYRYEKPEGNVIDGALFAFVTSAGTDPEVMIALEARQEREKTAWYYRAIRFSDSNLYVQHKGKEVWTSIRDNAHTLHYNADHTYRLIRAHYLDELPEMAAQRVEEEP